MNEVKVLGFNTALEAGFEPRNYSWLTADVPIGEYSATLDFMIWSKKQVAVDCYLTTIADGKKIKLTAYRNQAEDYLAGDTAIRFLPFGTILTVTVDLNGNGNPKWLKAVVADNADPAQKQ